MRIIITTLIVVLNFILQTTLFPYLAIQGVFPNTALIIVTSYSLLRGSKEGALVGAGTGFHLHRLLYCAVSFDWVDFRAKPTQLFPRKLYSADYFLRDCHNLLSGSAVCFKLCVPRRRKYSLFPLPRTAAGAGLYDDCNRSAVSGAVWHQ